MDGTALFWLWKMGHHKTVNTKIFLHFTFPLYLRISESGESLNVKTKGKQIHLILSVLNEKLIMYRQKIGSKNNRSILTLNIWYPKCFRLQTFLIANMMSYREFLYYMILCICFMHKRYVKLPSCYIYMWMINNFHV